MTKGTSMAKTVVMPQMGYDMDAGTLLRWIKNVGDTVERGDAIAEIETDKVNIEIEAFDSGVLRRTLIEEGQTVPVGEAIAIIGGADEALDDDASASAAPANAEATGKAEAEASEQPVKAAQDGAEGAEGTDVDAPEAATADITGETVVQEAPATASASTSTGADVVVSERVRASPLVRRLATEHEIDLRQVTGSGPHGRIVKRDIDGMVSGEVPKPSAKPTAAPAAQPAQPAPAAAAPAAQPAATAAPKQEQAAAAAPSQKPAAPSGAPLGELVELPRIRQTIARRLSESFSTIPHFYVTMAIDMTEATELQKQINPQMPEGTSITVNDFIIKASALALRSFPVLNSAWADGKMQTHTSIDINVAVAIDGGLISPFVPAADTKSLGEISRSVKDLAGRARKGGLKPDEFQGGTFTISNIGMFGVEDFIAIINPPQCAILAIGAAKAEAVWDDESESFVRRQVMKVTLSADHRLTDGAEVARFLQELKRQLENPMLLLVG